MRKLLLLCSLAAVTACAEDHGYEISGTLTPSEGNEKILVSVLNDSTNQPTVIDTVEVVNGKFELDLPEVNSPTISFLGMEGVRGNVLFIADNTPITFEIYRDSLYASKIQGGADNKVLSDITTSMIASQQEIGKIRSTMMEAFSTQDTSALQAAQAEQDAVIAQTNAKKRELVENNPSSIVSLMLMHEMIGAKMFPSSELKDLYSNLSSDVKATSYGKVVEEALNNMNQVELGNKAPDFSAPTPEGATLSLNEVLGKVTLIDFWASWCKPCREENPNIVKVYKKYHDKGFNIIGVSLDREGQKDKWMQAIADDKLTWAQVSNLQFWQDPVARQYGIQAIPAAFLLDENGVIIATNLRGPDLEEKVAELLGEE